MTAEEKSIEIVANKAQQNLEDLLQARYNISANFLVLARLLKDNRDNALWKILGYDSFEALLGSPELGFRRSKAYSLIRLYELYIQKLCVPERDIVEIGNAKLTLISSVVESDVDSWLSKAKSLSKSDLLISLAEAAGKPLPRLSPPSPPSQPSSCCCVCGATEWEKSHFPITRGAGGQEVEDWWIPMCRVCHSEFHNDPKEWCWTYKRKWAKYLYGARGK